MLGLPYRQVISPKSLNALLTASQLTILVLAKDSAEFGVTIAAIPVVLILLILCGVAVQREIKWFVIIALFVETSITFVDSRLMTISLVMMLAAMSYCELHVFCVTTI